jgi:hypothetical protein
LRDGWLRLTLLLPLVAALPTGCASPQRTPVRQAVSPSPPAEPTPVAPAASGAASVGTLFGDSHPARPETSTARVAGPANTAAPSIAADSRIAAPALVPDPPEEGTLTSGLKKLFNPFAASPARPRPLPRTDRAASAGQSLAAGESTHTPPEPSPAPRGFAF